VTEPFLLHVGDVHARRNLEVVVTALLDLRARHAAGPAMPLVLAGVDRGVGDDLRAMAVHGGAPDAVILLGAVEEELLHALYRAAAALVYPSRYEGFGLPLLEAMASGTPVVASRAASIPEVVGEAGLLLAPDDAGAWSEAIQRVTTDGALRERLRAAGLARAGLFTWASAARLTLDVYRRVSEARA
jgi:glycosyltransferase involved in cell wall biosynthesis